jgi:hypothetical protein
MSKFQTVYENAINNVTVNPEQLKRDISSKLSTLSPASKAAIGGVAGALDTENPFDRLLTAVQKDPNIMQKLTPQQKEALNKILNPENTDTTTQQNKGQTNGQNPTLDMVQKQQAPTSNAATRPLV